MSTELSTRPPPLDGEESPTRRYGPITRTHLVRYAGASGDFNPIHHDEKFAAGAGYPSVLGHGLLTAGILSSYVTEWLGQENLTHFGVRYVDQVWPGNTLVVDGKVQNRATQDLSTRISCELVVQAESEDGQMRTVLRGSATAVYSEESGDEK